MRELAKLQENSIFSMGVDTYNMNPKWKQKKNGAVEVFEEIKAENFIKLTKKKNQAIYSRSTKNIKPKNKWIKIFKRHKYDLYLKKLCKIWDIQKKNLKSIQRK